MIEKEFKFLMIRMKKEIVQFNYRSVYRII
jgi:hypothetical protein